MLYTISSITILSPLTDRHSPQARDIPQWGCTKHPAVFAAKLGRALVTDMERCGRGVQPLCHHQSSGFLQSQMLLVLQRTERRHGPKVMMKG